jgi:hypothetical protein
VGTPDVGINLCNDEETIMDKEVQEVINHDSKNGLKPIGYIGIRPDNPNLRQDSFACLQFTGLAIHLYPDGTWDWEDTTGG